MVRAVDELEFSRGFGADALLSLHEAASLAGITVAELRSRIEDGPVEARIHTEDGVRYPGVTRAELARHCPDRYPSVGMAVATPAGEPAADPRVELLEYEISEIRRELAGARAEAASLQADADSLRAELETASRIERSLQRYVDRVESKLAASRRELVEARTEPRPAPVAQPAPRREPSKKPSRSPVWRRWFGRARDPIYA